MTRGVWGPSSPAVCKETEGSVEIHMAEGTVVALAVVWQDPGRALKPDVPRNPVSLTPHREDAWEPRDSLHRG